MLRLPELKVLDLSSNDLLGKFEIGIQDAAEWSSSLHALNLSQNRLTRISIHPLELGALEVLDLSRNELSELSFFYPQWMAKGNDSRIFRFYDNPIERLDWPNALLGTIPEDCKRLSRLSSLSLVQNNLTSLPDDWGAMATSLRSLDVRSNRYLGLLPREVLKLRNLTSYFSAGTP